MDNKLITFFLCFVSYTCISQIDSFNISAYIYPDISRTTFRISPDLSYNKIIEARNSALFSGRDEQTVDFDFIVERNNTSNSRKRQLNNYLGGVLQYYERLEDTFLNLIGQLRFNLENRYFIDTTKFFEVELNKNLVYFKRSDSRQPQDSENFIGRIEVSPKYGWGRVENISDSWHAVVILDQLNEKGFLKRQPSYNEITDFAIKISQMKNFRNTDFRLEDLFEFESIINHLIDSGLGKEGEAGFYAVVKDAYEYEAFQRREHGNTLKVGMELDLNSTNIENGFDSKSYALLAEYERKKAKSKLLQFDQFYAVNIGQWNHKSSIPFSDPVQTIVHSSAYIEAQVDFRLGIFLSQRTNLNLGANIDYRYFSLLEDYDLNTRLIASGRYYISPKLRYSLSADIKLTYNHSGIFPGYNNNSSSIFRFGLDYFIQ